MPKKPQTPYEVAAARLRWLTKQLQEVREQRIAFSTPPDDPLAAQGWRPVPTATTACLAEERRLRKELDEVRLQVAELAEVERVNARRLTDEEKAAALAGLISNATDAELDAVVAEWLRRMRYRAYVDEGGTLHVVPLGDDVPVLRVVS